MPKADSTTESLCSKTSILSFNGSNRLFIISQTAHVFGTSSISFSCIKLSSSSGDGISAPRINFEGPRFIKTSLEVLSIFILSPVGNSIEFSSLFNFH
jgi:hypothetical protein